VMVMLDNAVTEIVKSVPEEYYRHGETQAAPAPQEEIIGGSRSFRPGTKVVFEETFAKYEPGDVPSGWNIKADTAEIALFRDRKWLRFLEPASASRPVAFPADCSLEFFAYLSSSASGLVCVMDGISVGFSGGTAVSLGATQVQLPADLKGSVHTVGISRKAGKVRLFIDGTQVAQTAVEEGKASVSSGTLKFSATVDLNGKAEVLVGGIRLAGYEQ